MLRQRCHRLPLLPVSLRCVPRAPADDDYDDDDDDDDDDSSTASSRSCVADVLRNPLALLQSSVLLLGLP